MSHDSTSRSPMNLELNRREVVGGTIATGAALAASGSLTSRKVVAQEPGRNATVIFDVDAGRVQSPELWNPFVPGFRGDIGYNQAMHEPLFILNYETAEIEPWLCESFTPNDTLDVWTLKIRDGVTWSDGEAFDADDIVFTIQMLVDGPAELSSSASMKQWVKSLKKVDPLTVEFTLTGVNPRFQLDYFSVRVAGTTPIVPEHIWNGQDPLTFTFYDKDKKWPVFTGPYTLTSVSQTEVIYDRNPEWWGAKVDFLPLPKPERLKWVTNETEEIKAARAANHELDSVMDITVGAFEALKAQNPDMIAWKAELPYSWVDPCCRLLSVNHTVEPWGDPELRRALNYAIDRDAVVAIAYEGSTTPARFYFPAYPPMDELVGLLDESGAYEKYPFTEFNLDKMAEILEGKGYAKGDDGYWAKDGKPLQLLISTHEAFIELQRLAQIVTEQLQTAGINATTRTLAGGTWFDDKDMGNYEAVVDWDACGSVSEPWLTMDRYNEKWAVAVGERAPGANNHIRWKSPEYSKPVDEMANLPLGDEAIKEHFVAAGTVFLEEVPFFPVAQAKKLVPFDTFYWKGWPSEENNYLHPATWWNSAHKIIHKLEPSGN